MKKILFVFTLLISVTLFSQQKTFSLNWNGSEVLAAGEKAFNIPQFTPKENYSYDFNSGLQFVSQWKTSTLVDERSVTLTNVTYQPINRAELKDVDVKTIPTTLTFLLKNSIDRGKTYAMLSVSALVKSVSGEIKKVVSFKVNYSDSNSRRTSFNRNQPISNSVLATGLWYKFAVDKSGVHKISKAFLNQMGLYTDGVNPRNIKIYGNGGQMLPYNNNANYPYDPVENAIQVVGEEDGVFNDNDYILFYGVGPKGDINNPLINTNVNPYTDVTYYYINISSGFGKRIQNMNQPTAPSTLSINTFQEFKFHEVDEFNLGFVGRRWFGDKFDVETVKIFDFSFPDLVTTEPIKLKIIGLSTSASLATMKISLNGTEINTLEIQGVVDPNVVAEAIYEDNVLASNGNISIGIDFDKMGVPSAVGYLDYITIEATRNLSFSGNQFQFKNNITSQVSGVAEYTLSNAGAVVEVWNITDINNITSVPNTNGAGSLSFKDTLGSLKNFAIVTNLDLYSPIQAPNSVVLNQDIKGNIFEDTQGNFKDIDYLIITPFANYPQAERLAQINRLHNNLNVKVLTLEHIYAEFSNGNYDISAIRNLVKYVYDNASTPEKRIKYLCLFGDSSFDYKSRIAPNPYNVPLWNAYDSFNFTNSYISDDFYGMMDENEGTLQFGDKLDIAVGRILADSPQRAKTLIDKIETYYSKEAYGSWRNNFIVVSDDVDDAWERVLQETTDEIGNVVSQERPFLNAVKIHSDSYQQITSAGGGRYPEVNTAISNAIENGALVVNYFGHGGEDGLAFERIFQKAEGQALRNECKLPCFVTVTCEYTRFDNPSRITAGELIYWNEKGGSISLITTTREIFVSVGITFNLILEEYLFSFNDSDNFGENEYPTMAEALRLTKNNPSIAGINQKNLVFFIGDPAMKLAFPEPNVVLTKINDVPVSGQTDVLEALSYAKLSGEVTDESGNLLSNYNGTLTTTIYDKPIQRQTLANDNTSEGGVLIKLDYETLGEVIFRGQATITNGEFDFDFIVPRDIGIPVGFGKVSFYASTESPLSNQAGGDTGVLQIGGINENAPEDNAGPLINLYMNDENFVSGGITNESPNLLVKLQDENGINTASGIGHDIIAILDGDEVNPFVLNNYYVTEIDDYTRGNLSFPLRDIAPGVHTLTVKAWDVYNNSSISQLQFVVFNEDENLVIDRVLNYPNPFVNYTEFWFTHNSSETLDISVQIFTISGKLIRTLNGQSLGAGGKKGSSTSRDIVWDGRDDFGDKIGKGTYVYKLKVHSSATNKTVEKVEKLVIL